MCVGLDQVCLLCCAPGRLAALSTDTPPVLDSVCVAALYCACWLCYCSPVNTYGVTGKLYGLNAAPCKPCPR
jgi:hypothetical protein